MKRLNFRHFNTNSKQFTVTVNFIQKETKTAPKRPILFCLLVSRSFRPFSDDSRSFRKISEDYRRFSKTAEDVRRLPKISEEKSENFRLYFRRYIHVKDFYSERNPCNSLYCFFFYEKPSKHLTVFSPETVNTNNYGQITLHTKPHSDPLLKPLLSMPPKLLTER